MKFVMPCETATKYLLPALRVCIAKDLSKEYKFSQMNIASILSVTQPAVSKYLTGSVDRKIKELTKDEKIQKHAHSIAKDISLKKLDNEKVIDTMLKICDELVDDYPDLE